MEGSLTEGGQDFYCASSADQSSLVSTSGGIAQGCRQFEVGKRNFMKNFLSVLLSTKFSSLLYFYEFSQSGSVALGIVYI